MSTTVQFAKKLTPKQKLFCKEYLIDLNATQAAIRSGYSEKTAYSQGQRLLKNVEAKRLIQNLMDKRAEKVEIKSDEILAEIKKMAFANMLDYMTIDKDGSAFVDLSKLTREQAAAISQLEVESYWDKDLKKTVKKIKFKLADKYKGQELLGRHRKLFIDKHEITGKDGAPLVLPDLTGKTAEELAKIALDQRTKRQ